MNFRLLAIPLLPIRIIALYPGVIVYRWSGSLTIEQLSREMVRLQQMERHRLNYWLLWLYHLCRYGKRSPIGFEIRNWATVHYGQAMEVLEEHGFA